MATLEINGGDSVNKTNSQFIGIKLAYLEFHYNNDKE